MYIGNLNQLHAFLSYVVINVDITTAWTIIKTPAGQVLLLRFIKKRYV